jgi:hypothetical protein
LTKILDTFTSQIGDKRILMEEVAGHSGLMEEASQVPAGKARWWGKTLSPLALDLDCLVLAVADRKARPGLK